MITLFELKNKSFCKCFIRTPGYVKNVFLLGILSFLLTIIYAIYFSRDGNSALRIQSIVKLLKGLNSDTFNYLTGHADSLKLTKLLNNYQMQINSNQFIDDCMRISKPCKFEGLAKTWPGYEEWKYGTTGKPYEALEKLVGSSTIMDVYIDMDPDAYIDSAPQDSFKKDIHAKMRYSEFLTKSSQESNSLGMVLRDESESTTKNLL